MDDWDAIPTVVPSKDPPLGEQKEEEGGGPQSRGTGWRRWWWRRWRAYMMSWALSWRNRGSRSLERHSRKLLRVLVGFFSTLI